LRCWSTDANREMVGGQSERHFQLNIVEYQRFIEITSHTRAFIIAPRGSQLPRGKLPNYQRADASAKQRRVGHGFKMAVKHSRRVVAAFAAGGR
jgi:hypothetical protein